MLKIHGLHILDTPEISQWQQHGFTPVPYIPDKIAYVQVRTPLAISSKFSGCAMALFYFNSQPGIRYVCHISTGGAKKTLEDEFQKRDEITIDAYFKPADIRPIVLHRYKDRVSKDNADFISGVFGIITKDCVCYSVVIRRNGQNKRLVFAWMKWGTDNTVHILPE